MGKVGVAARRSLIASAFFVIGLPSLTEDVEYTYSAAIAGILLLGALLLAAPPELRLLPALSLLRRIAANALPLVLVALVAVQMGSKSLYWPILLAAVPLCARALVRSRRSEGGSTTRVAVIGDPAFATDVMDELEQARVDDHVIVGYVDPDPRQTELNDRLNSVRNSGVSLLGDIDGLAGIVERARIDQLLVAPEVSRLRVFRSVVCSCLHLDVRVISLAAFYEGIFGRVPIGAINEVWFKDLFNPSARTKADAIAGRVLDVSVSGLALILMSPIIGVLAVLVRLDGGTAFFRQQRTGKGGRPFEIVKLRTMKAVEHSSQGRWAQPDDARVTAVGRLLRRTHLDELPQLYNIIRGDMSLVGPRPEQIDIADSLSSALPYYEARHMVRPGLSGWAQVRSGYLGSEAGSALKLSYDLYYVKHHSLALDVLILVETVRTLLGRNQWTCQRVPERFVPVPVYGESSAGPVSVEHHALSARG